MPRGKARAGIGKRGRPFSASTLRRTLEAASFADIQAELQRRQSMVREIMTRRDALAAELATIDRELADAGGNIPAVKRGRGRPRKSPGFSAAPTAIARPGMHKRRRAGRGGNTTNLVGALQKALSGTTMSVVDAADAVKRAGYQTKSANFRTIVNQALISNSDVFRKVARGQYTAR